MINFDDFTGENKTKNNLNWSYMTEHPCRALIIWGSG